MYPGCGSAGDGSAGDGSAGRMDHLLTPPIPTTHVRLHKTGIDQGTPSESQQPAWLIHPPPLSSSNLQLVLSAAVRTDLFLWRKTSCLKKELRLLNTIFCGFNQSVSILSFTQTSEH